MNYNFKLKRISSNIQPNIKQVNYYSVPLNIFQHWHTLDLPPNMKSTVKLLKIQNPEFKHFLYDTAMCREFIKNNFNEDVLYTFDKLNPCAFKADLWRYCVLYIHGGIYLDIKYECVNNFKLINLTDKEYYVKDRHYKGMTGIYNALISSKPKNYKLYNCINKIVMNVKNNIYGSSELDITGPHMMIEYFNDKIRDIDLYFDGSSINRSTPTFMAKFNLKNSTNTILTTYNTYREEQSKYQLNKRYHDIWHDKCVYNYPNIKTLRTINFTKVIHKNILGEMVELYSGTPTIIEMNGSYLVNIRWINYKYTLEGNIIEYPKNWISLNSRFTVDLNFNKTSDEIFLEEDFEKQKDNDKIGIEDIRIFKFNDLHYYIATMFDVNRNVMSVSSDIYNISDTYQLNRNIILPTMYDLSNIRMEKNWSFVKYKNELCVIYNWHPMQIGKINYTTKTLNIIEEKNLPEYFKDARGSTCGYTKNNEIWFVLHKAQCSYKNQFNYQDFFAIFDLDMNLLRYSELFKFDNCKVEFCTGLIVKDESIILSYSLMDTQSMISEYHINDINNIKWYNIKGAKF
jgi:mannosyltransferase OCH1-like enzyme